MADPPVPAARASTLPSTGPMHGVQAKANAIPMTGGAQAPSTRGTHDEAALADQGHGQADAGGHGHQDRSEHHDEDARDGLERALVGEEEPCRWPRPTPRGW